MLNFVEQYQVVQSVRRDCRDDQLRSVVTDVTLPLSPQTNPAALLWMLSMLF